MRATEMGGEGRGTAEAILGTAREGARPVPTVIGDLGTSARLAWISFVVPARLRSEA